MNVSELSVKKPVSTLIIVIALLVLGVTGYNTLSVDLLPSVDYPLVFIRASWPGATPDEIERNIAEPIESRMAGVDHLDELSSTCSQSNYRLRVQLKQGIDVNIAYQDVLASMQRIRMPSGVDPPTVIKADPSQIPVIELAVNSNRHDLVYLRNWVEEWLQDKMVSVSGVAGTEVVGGLQREIRIKLKPDSLEKHHISLETVLGRLRSENVEQFAGRVRIDGMDLIAKTMGSYKSIDEIKNVVAADNGLSKLYMKDLGDISDANETVTIYSRLNGANAVKLRITKQAGANTVETIKSIQKKMAELYPSFPEGIQITYLENQAIYIEASLEGVRSSALQASILLVLVVLLFLGNWRQALTLLLALPITIITNFGLMGLFDFSMNIFSLSGMVIAIGVIVDNSTVVIENITRLMHENPERPMHHVILQGTREVRSAIIGSTLSFISLFMPFIMIKDTTSLLFRELIFVIACVVIISLGVSLTVTPMLMSLLFKENSKAKKKINFFDRFFDKVMHGYGKVLTEVVRFKWLTIGSFSLVVILAMSLLARIGTEFLPKVDDGRLSVRISLPTGTSVDITDRITREVEKLLDKDDAVESYYSLVGGQGGFVVEENSHRGSIDIQLVPKSKRKASSDDFLNEFRKNITKLSSPETRISINPKGIRGIPRFGGTDFQITLKGPDLRELDDYSTKIVDRLTPLSFIANIYSDVDLKKPEYQIIIDRTKAAELGLSIDSIANSLQSFITGSIASQFREKDYFYNIRVLIPEEHFNSVKDIENLALFSSSSRYVRLNEVAKIVPALGPVQIARVNQEKFVTLNTDLKDIYLSQALVEISKELDEFKSPAGVHYEFGGQAQVMREMVDSILTIFLFAIFFSFVIHAVQFNNALYPLQILLCIPYCLSGLVFILFLTNLPLGATVIVGLLIVVSANISDGVLLITFAEDLRLNEGYTPFEAILKSAKLRMRPRIMTTVTTTVGFIPLAVFVEAGGEMLQPMAVGTIGGLIFEVVVTLFLMPCFYMLMTKGKSKSQLQVISEG